MKSVTLKQSYQTLLKYSYGMFLRNVPAECSNAERLSRGRRRSCGCCGCMGHAEQVTYAYIGIYIGVCIDTRSHA